MWVKNNIRAFADAVFLRSHAAPQALRVCLSHKGWIQRWGSAALAVGGGLSGKHASRLLHAGTDLTELVE